MLQILALLLLVNLSMALSAGIYEARLVLPLWFPINGGVYSVDKAALQRLDSGRKFWGMVTTMPLTLLMIILLVSICKAGLSTHPWLSAAVLLTLLERALTFSFFIPTIIKLSKGSFTADRVHLMVNRWKAINVLRLLMTAVAIGLVIGEVIMISSLLSFKLKFLRN